jgi:NAD(P)H-dependent flavin oxidoreductase YrpB (nitropropane dioxygenase family)
MRNNLCDLLDIEVPVFAFSHSPKVVAAVTNAGGLGVLGAVRYTPEHLNEVLDWIAKECKGKSFGVDLIIPAKYVGSDEGGLTPDEVAKLIPAAHQAFLADLLQQYNVPELAAKLPTRYTDQSFTLKGAEKQLEVTFDYPIRLLVNALGTPPPDIIAEAHERNIMVGALVGTVAHALKQKEVGVDLIIAQGYEAGGHTGDIATMVLVPQVVDAVAPVPVLAAGGIVSGRQIAAAFALGAQGVWTGSVWLTTAEAETHPVVKEKFLKATSSDTLRSRANTGKPARQLRTAWTDAWEAPQNPKPLPMPLQSALVGEAQQRIGQDALNGGQGGTELINYFVGQAVGMLKEIKPTAEVLRTLVAEYEATLQAMTNNRNEE